jgi:hypothetical protein
MRGFESRELIGAESLEVIDGARPDAATRFATILRSGRLTESGVIGSSDGALPHRSEPILRAALTVGIHDTRLLSVPMAIRCAKV